MSIPVPAKYIADFEKRGFGMFIHWGLYSQLAQGELDDEPASYFPGKVHRAVQQLYGGGLRCKEDCGAGQTGGHEIHHADDAAPRRFFIVRYPRFDRLRRHAYTVRTGSGQRICRGLPRGRYPADLYHTTLDWVHPDFDADFDAYLEYLSKSVEILCTHYGKIGGLWFDGNWSKRDADWKLDEFYGMIRRLQPDAMIINNTGPSRQGEAGHPELDSVTFEQGQATPMDREGKAKYITAEMCQTMNRHWGIAAHDLDYKSPRQMIERLCHARKVGANYLLNIGLTGQGGVTKMTEALLESFGQWTAMAKDSLYDGKVCDIRCSHEKDFVLGKDGAAYVHRQTIFRYWGRRTSSRRMKAPMRIIRWSKLHRKVKSIRWIDNGEELLFSQKDDVCSYRAVGFPSMRQPPRIATCCQSGV